MKHWKQHLLGVVLGILGGSAVLAGAVYQGGVGRIGILPGKVNSNNALVISVGAVGTQGSATGQIGTLPGKVNSNNALVVALDSGSGSLPIPTGSCVSFGNTPDTWIQRDAAGSVGISGVSCGGASSGSIDVGTVLFSGGQSLVGTTADVTTYKNAAAATRWQLAEDAVNGVTSVASNPLNGGTATIFGDAANTFFGLAHFGSGFDAAAMVARNGNQEIESWIWSGAAYQPVFTQLATSTSNTVQIRKPDDSRGVNINFQSASNPRMYVDVPSGTNQAGVDMEYAGGVGTGNATPGNVRIMVSSAGSSGTTLQTFNEIAVFRPSDIIFNYPLRIGSTYAGVGLIRMPNGASASTNRIAFRNAANNNNFTFGLNGSDVFEFLGASDADTATVKANTATFAAYNFNGTSGKTGTTCTAFTVGGCTAATEPNSAYFAQIIAPSIADAGFVLLTADEYADFQAMRSAWKRGVK